MGAANSKKKTYSKDDLFKIVNKISSDLILNTADDDLINFMEPKYCIKIIKLSSRLLNDNFTKNELKLISDKLISDKLKDKVIDILNKKKIINDTIKWSKSQSVTDTSVTDTSVTDTSVTDTSVTDTSVTDTSVTDTSATGTSLTDINVMGLTGPSLMGLTGPSVTGPSLTTDSINNIYSDEYQTKKEICKVISVHYVKIMHIFSAIKTILDSNETFCKKNKKFKYKKNKIQINDSNISAEICNTGKNEIYGSENSIPKLGSENAIPELENLYKDEYVGENIFKMSEKSTEKYNIDLISFYESYTGKDKKKEITSFSQIPVFDYKSDELCKKMEKKMGASLNNELQGDSKNYNIIMFANHLAKIMNESNIIDNTLIETLNLLFVIDETDHYIINEKLTSNGVDKLTETVRATIMELYINCEKDYKKGVELFENILLSKNIYLVENRIDSKKMKESTEEITKSVEEINKNIEELKDF